MEMEGSHKCLCKMVVVNGYGSNNYGRTLRGLANNEVRVIKVDFIHEIYRAIRVVLKESTKLYILLLRYIA
jgi:hypothetical protein